MGFEQGFEVIYDTQITTTSGGGPWQPGQIVLHRSGTGRGQQALAKWVLLDNNGCSQGEALVSDTAQTVEHGVKTSATTDQGAPMRGIAAATIASNKFGFAIIGGYCEKLDTSQTVASGEYLMIGGSTAAKFTNDKASCFNLGTQGNASQFMVVAVARGAFATGVGSVSILGLWG